MPCYVLGSAALARTGTAAAVRAVSPEELTDPYVESWGLILLFHNSQVSRVPLETSDQLRILLLP